MLIRSSWNGIIVIVTICVGALAGIVAGTLRNAALLRQTAAPADAVDFLDASGADEWFFILIDGMLGASVALTILAPPLAVATLFQARDLACAARLRSHREMQRAFPGARPSNESKVSTADLTVATLRTAKPS